MTECASSIRHRFDPGSLREHVHHGTPFCWQLKLLFVSWIVSVSVNQEVTDIHTRKSIDFSIQGSQQDLNSRSYFDP